MEETKMLKLIWKAQFSDGSILNQFDDIEQTKEHLFKEVLEKQSQLLLFYLFNTCTQKIYSVNLPLGVLSVGQPSEFESDQLQPSAQNRLIYFRRIVRELSIGPKTITVNLNEGKLKQISYFLGFQYTDEKGNHKKVIQIFENDNITIY